MAVGEIRVATASPRAGLTGRVRELFDREGVLGPLFVTPALIILLLLVAYPFAMALYFALSNAFIGRPSHLVGLRNFINLWDSDAFRQTFQNAFVFTGIAVAFKVVLGISLALLLNQQLWFKRMIRGAVLLPWVIPKELYEAAEADGAGAVSRFWYVTLPLLKGVLAIVVLFSTIFTFSDFNIVYVLTHGGPINSTHLFATLARQIGLETGRIGEGAAISLYLFPVLVLVVWAQLRFVRKQAY